MAFSEGSLPVMLFILCLTLLNFSCAEPRHREETLNQVFEPRTLPPSWRGWLNNLTIPTLQPFDWWWRRTTQNPWRRTVEPTPSPWDWRRTLEPTRNPWDWRLTVEPTRNPWDWGRRTMEPTRNPWDWLRTVEPTRNPWDWGRRTMEPTRNPWDWLRTVEPTRNPWDWLRTVEPRTFPYDWWKRTIKPYTPLPTVDPFDFWNRNRNTKNPNDWINRYTKSPYDDYSYKPVDNTSIKLAIFLPTTIGLVILLVCKYFVCNGDRDSNTSSPVLHPPPRRVVPPPVSAPQTRIWTETSNGVRSESSQRQELFFVGANRSSPSDIHDSFNINTAGTDKPPGYSDVVIADLLGEGPNTFPEVRPTFPETPPPDYSIHDEKNITRY